MSKHRYFVYILTNKRHTVLYTGFTGALRQRVQQHKEGKGGEFTSRYNVDKLVHAEEYQYVHDAKNGRSRLKADRAKRSWISLRPTTRTGAIFMRI